jgi:hypothetical protein
MRRNVCMFLKTPTDSLKRDSLQGKFPFSLRAAVH